MERGRHRKSADVTEKEWIGHALHALAWTIPGEVVRFGLAELEDAENWAAGPAAFAVAAPATKQFHAEQARPHP